MVIRLIVSLFSSLPFLSVIGICIVGTGCVTTGTYEAAMAAEAQKQQTLQGQLDETQSVLTDTKTSKSKTEQKLTAAMQQNQQLVSKVAAMGQNVEQLLGEKDSLSEERTKLSAEIAELQRMREAAERRNFEYKNLLTKLSKMIDAGSLSVKVRKGRMLVTMSSDVLFQPGRADLKEEAKVAITELAQTIAGFPNRRFQIIGHSDAAPIHTARFPSNWELSSQRAIEVVRVMVDAGVPADMLSAAGAAEFDPLVDNETPENRALNRRVELVFVPKIDELPGFEQLLAEQ